MGSALQVPRQEDGDISFLSGMNSVPDPLQLPPSSYPRSMNMLNRGGILQCRPGYRCRFALPAGNLQGCTIFRPKIGSELMLMAVEGRVYVSDYPYKEYRIVPGLTFSPIARQLYFKQVEQSSTRNADGSLALTTPRNLLIIQDGALSPAGVFDGARGEHTRDIPSGGTMEWVGDRLWVARGNKVFASDLGNPLSFTEDVYIVGGVQAFIFPSVVVSLTRTSATNTAQLLVFTETSTELLQAGVRDRSTWLATPDFQRVIFPNIGCISERSVVAHYGLLWWYSSQGLISFDAASQTLNSSVLPLRDNETIFIKSLLSEDLSGIAIAAHENYLLVSVPYADLLNSATLVLDNAAYQTLQVQVPPAWNSYWTGTRPVQWMTGLINGFNQAFYVSADYDGNNRLWEAFTADRLDEGCPITWWFETRGYFGKAASDLKEFRFADIYLSELSGVVDLGVYWAGYARGKYKNILNTRLDATRGVFRPGQVISATDKIYALKKQSRRIRTQDGRELSETYTLSSCGVEAPNAEFIDNAFQLLVVGQGPCAVRAVKIFLDPVEGDNVSGDCTPEEGEVNLVRFDGAADEDEDFSTAKAALDEHEIEFTSQQTVAITQGGITTVGTGSGQSILTQAAADRQAQAEATARAAHELEHALPQIVSLGEMANDL